MTLGKMAGSNYTLTGNHSDSIHTLHGSGNGRFTIRVLHNNGGPEREADITVTTGSMTDSVHVWQDWGAVVVNGIKYGRINPNKVFDSYVSVVAKEPGYSGNIVIPTAMAYRGVTYQVEAIHADAFMDCSALTSVSISYGVKYIEDRAFLRCFGLAHIVVPNSVTSIGTDAFRLCSSLTSIIIPNSVTSMGEGAFWGCNSLASVTLPASLTGLPHLTFGHCYALASVEVGWATPVSTQLVFYDGTGESYLDYDSNYKNATLIVPQGTRELYAVSYDWKDFKKIVEKVSPDSLFFTAGASEALTDSIFITTHVPWTVTEDIDWLTVSPMSGAGNDTLVVTAAVNDSGADRTGEFVFANAIPNGTNDSIRIKVEQESNLQLRLSKDSLTMEASASATTVALTCYIPWEVTAVPDWLTVAPPSGSAPAVLTITAAENEGIARSADVVISYSDTTKILHVAQCPNPVITADPPTIDAVLLSVQTVTVHVTAFADWTVTVVPEEHSSWLRIAAPQLQSAGSGTAWTFTVAIFPNLGAARSAEIVIDNGFTIRKILVTQPAGPLL
jgi:hypothetical protein